MVGVVVWKVVKYGPRLDHFVGLEVGDEVDDLL